MFGRNNEDALGDRDIIFETVSNSGIDVTVTHITPLYTGYTYSFGKKAYISEKDHLSKVGNGGTFMMHGISFADNTFFADLSVGPTINGHGHLVAMMEYAEVITPRQAVPFSGYKPQGMIEFNSSNKDTLAFYILGEINPFRRQVQSNMLINYRGRNKLERGQTQSVLTQMKVWNRQIAQVIGTLCVNERVIKKIDSYDLHEELKT